MEDKNNNTEILEEIRKELIELAQSKLYKFEVEEDREKWYHEVMRDMANRGLLSPVVSLEIDLSKEEPI